MKNTVTENKEVGEWSSSLGSGQQNCINRNSYIRINENWVCRNPGSSGVPKGRTVTSVKLKSFNLGYEFITIECTCLEN